MEENKVASDRELWARAEKLWLAIRDESDYEETLDIIFRELVAVRDQAAKYTTAEGWKQMHAEITND